MRISNDNKTRLVSLGLASTLFAWPFQSVASTTVSTLQTSQLQTSTAGNIEITPSGQLNVAGADAIQINSAGATVTLDPGNTNGGPPGVAIRTTASGQGIDILAGAGMNSAAMITVGANTSIVAANSGIQVNDTTATIINSGTVSGSTSAIQILTGGTLANITNNSGGILQGNITNTAPTVLVSDMGLTLSNAGTISSNTAQDALQLNQNFATITNGPPGNTLTDLGIVNSSSGNAVNFNGTNITGAFTNNGTISVSGTGNAVAFTGTGVAASLTNTGTITATGNGNAIGISGTVTSTITNSGVLSVNGVGAAFIAATGTGAFNGVLNNSGSILGNANGNAILINGAASTAIINNNSGGLIATTGALSPVVISKNISQFNNNGGTIQNLAGTTVVSIGSNVIIANGFYNSGNITATGVGAAVSIQANTQVTFNQNGGIITGDVNLASKDSAGTNNVFFMTGGTINGNVNAQSVQSNTIALSGGSITKAVNLGALGDTVNLSGTATFGAINGGAGTDTLNIVGSYNYASGTLSSIETLEVKNSGTAFTVNTPIFATSGISNIIIDPNTSLTANQNITITAAPATITNNGSISVAPNTFVKATTYNQSATGSYAALIPFDPTVVGPLQPSVGEIQTTGSANVLGTVAPILDTPNFIPAGTEYDILQTPAGLLTNSATISTLYSPIVFFTFGTGGPSPNTVNCGGNTCIQLISARNPYVSAATSDVAIAVASTLDGIVPLYPNINPDILALLSALDRLTSISQVTAALETLAPGYNYALPMSSHISMNNAFDSAQIRIEDLRGLGPIRQEDMTLRRDQELYNGLGYGDVSDIYGGPGTAGAWFKINGDYDSQRQRHNIPGYAINNIGFAIGGDWRVTDDVVVGIGGSYNKVNTYDYTQQRNTVDIKSYQITFYSWLQPYNSLYVDAMLGICSHVYSTLRNIPIANATALGGFYGLHYGAQVDVGYAFLNSDDFYVAPFARLKYTYLDIDNYTEYGAGGINLNVINESLDEAIAGVGIRFGVRKDYIEAIYVPEISAMVLYDFSGHPQEMQSSFLGGGVPFYITGIKPAQFMYLFGFGVNAHTSDHYTATLKYNLEMRDHFYGNNIYLQLHYTFN